MKTEFFKAVCPLEIGDTVAIKVSKLSFKYFVYFGCVF